MGNVLMSDDGIAIYLAGILEEKLCKIGVEVIYGETDIGYCISQIQEGDYIILMDASDLGKTPGEITLLSFDEITAKDKDITQHCVSFLDLLKLYFPMNDGIVITVQIAYIGLQYGLSKQLKGNISEIAQELFKQVSNVKYSIEIS